MTKDNGSQNNREPTEGTLSPYDLLWAQIAEEWGRRDFWQQWDAVAVPSLLLEAENSVTPPGQMHTMSQAHENAILLRVKGSDHLIHDSAPDEYRGAVEAFLSGLA